MNGRATLEYWYFQISSIVSVIGNSHGKRICKEKRHVRSCAATVAFTPIDWQFKYRKVLEELLETILANFLLTEKGSSICSELNIMSCVQGANLPHYEYELSRNQQL